jgi:hypothetical protein
MHYDLGAVQGPVILTTMSAGTSGHGVIHVRSVLLSYDCANSAWKQPSSVCA